MVEAPSKRQPRPTPRIHRGRRAFLTIAGLLSLLLAVGSGLSIATIHYAESRLQKVCAGPTCTGPGTLRHVVPECADHACNFLVLGSDSRAGLSKRQQSQFGNTNVVQGQRSDTIILVHTDAGGKRTVVLSIPRDLRVEIPGHGVNKINSAFNYGPDVMVETVEKLTGMSINHYIEINFVGFQRLVDALGGVPICVDQPMNDQLAGLHLPHAGCYDLRGSQALAFVRARHVEGDRIPDFSRIARQQQFIRAVIQKVLSIGSVTRLPALIRAVQDNLVIDQNLDLYKLQDLTTKLASVGQAAVDFRVVPAVPVAIGGVDYVQAIQPDATRLFVKIRKGQYLGGLGREEPLTPLSPANVVVRVLDAGSGGKVDEVVSYLERAGFIVLPTENAPTGLTKSQILYAPGSDKEETVVKSYLPAFPIKADRKHTTGADVTVVVGPDYPGIG